MSVRKTKSSFLGKSVAVYLLGFVLAYVSVNIAFVVIYNAKYLAVNEMGPVSLEWKIEHYAENVDTYDLLFVGDSRTFCDLHPDLIDPLLGTSSYNLSKFANWIPTQYLFFRDLIPLIPKGTTVVWSIGMGNLSRKDFHPAYPIQTGDALRFLGLGLPLKDVMRTYARNNPFLLFPYKLNVIYTSLHKFFDKPVGSKSGVLTSSDAQKAWTLPSELDVRYSVPEYRDGKLVFVAHHTMRGSHYGVELSPEYFRNQQPKNQRKIKNMNMQTTLLPGHYALFNQILDMFKDAGVNVVVNILEESPGTYRADSPQEEWQRFFVETLGDDIRARGFPVIIPAAGQLSNEHYFDHNHLNSEGIKVYTPLFAEELKPHLAK